jgi:hypothetical protein
MDFQTMVSNAVAAERQKEFNKSNQLSLGEMLLKLEPIIKKQKEIIDKYKHEATVSYDFEYLFPKTIDSWRGAYEELALDINLEGEPLKVTEFYNLLKSCIGKKFTGYKGGEFIMSKNTPVWVANYGNSGHTCVIDIVDNEYEVLIKTGRRE